MRIEANGARSARFTRVRWLAVPLVFTVLAFSESGRTQPEAAEKGAETPQGLKLSEIRTALASGDQQETMLALAQLHGKPAAEFAVPLADLLGRGAPEPVVLAAIDVAKRLRSATLGSVLAPYLQHRSPKVRQVAAEALGATGGPEAIVALRAGLRTRDVRVRDLCAAALGEIRDSNAVPDLFLALDRGVSAAAISIGRSCNDAECRKLASKLGPVPFDVMSQGLKHVLLSKPDAQNKQSRVSAETKIEVIRRVADMKTPSAASLLRGVRTQWPEPLEPTVIKALDDAIQFLGGK